MKSVCKLLMSSHRLAIESGRWAWPARIPIEERKCAYCDLLEDEFHFVLECKCYTELRYKYIPRYFFRRPSMFKFVDIMRQTACLVLNPNHG